ncbi:hypothetical protein SNEBB_010700 [Seison nebaliae]|nr:hypothetical protein SNEBB_010700 [Seison nebaliae]
MLSLVNYSSDDDHEDDEGNIKKKVNKKEIVYSQYLPGIPKFKSISNQSIDVNEEEKPLEDFVKKSNIPYMKVKGEKKKIIITFSKEENEVKEVKNVKNENLKKSTNRSNLLNLLKSIPIQESEENHSSETKEETNKLNDIKSQLKAKEEKKDSTLKFLKDKLERNESKVTNRNYFSLQNHSTDMFAATGANDTNVIPIEMLPSRPTDEEVTKQNEMDEKRKRRIKEEENQSIDLSKDDEAFSSMLPLTERKKRKIEDVKKEVEEEINSIDMAKVVEENDELMFKNSTEEQNEYAGIQVPGGVGRRKNQIAYLAQVAVIKNFELKQKWASERHNRRENRKKYGFM